MALTSRRRSEATSRSELRARWMRCGTALSLPDMRWSAPVVRETNGIACGASIRQNSSSTWQSPGTTSAMGFAADQFTVSWCGNRAATTTPWRKEMDLMAHRPADGPANRPVHRPPRPGFLYPAHPAEDDYPP